MNTFAKSWNLPQDSLLPSQSHTSQTSAPITHTQQPAVTGTSVIATKYKDGIVIATDNLASYGSLARFTDVKRLRPYNDRVVLGFGGDVSDMQAINRMIDALAIRESYGSATPPEDRDVDTDLNAKNLHTFIQKQMYKRRSDLNPLWNAILVAGLDGESAPFLASVDLLGTTFTSPTLATGFGSMIAQPILRRTVPDEAAVANVSKEEAVELVKQCLKVLFYRDARSMDKYSIAVIEKGKDVDIRWNEKLENQSWEFAEEIRGYGTQTV